MKDHYDVIIIGAGHNGLTAAGLLARHGKSVLVLEKRETVGGVIAGEEFYPGYKSYGLLHDTSTLRLDLIRPLALEKYGLQTASRAAVVFLSDDGQSLILGSDVQQNSKEIARFSENDAVAYLRYVKFIKKIRPFVSHLTDSAPPDLNTLNSSTLWEMVQKGLRLRKMGSKSMMEFLKVAPMSLADFLDEQFETDFLKAGLAVPALSWSFHGPRSAYSTLSLLLYECRAAHQVIGGPPALLSSLEQSALELGVEIKTNCSVEEISLNTNGEAQGVQLADGTLVGASAIGASCAPQETFLKLLEPHQIDYTLEQEILQFRSRGITAKMELALSEAPKFKIPDQDHLEYFRIAGSLLGIEKAFDSVKYKSFSDPILDVYIPKAVHSGMAPDGHYVVSIVMHYAPYDLTGGWTEEQKQDLGDRIIDRLNDFAPDLKAAVVAYKLLTPADMEVDYSLPAGHLYHGEMAVDQLISRPGPLCGHYSTPIKGLYLCGSGSHPGGGITCAPGALAARSMLRGL